MIAEDQKELDQNELVGPLFEKVRDYVQTSIDLVKLKAIDKATGFASALVTRLVVMAAFTVFFLFANVGLSLWLGQVMGETYYGFLCVAGVYLVAWIILAASRSGMKKKINDTIVSRIMEDK